MPHRKIRSLNDIDLINKKIIAILKKDAKTPYKEIAEKLNISESTVRKRINNLVESKVIKKFTIEINPEFVKQNLHAFITIVPKEGKMNQVIELVRNQSHCSEVFCLSGKCGVLMITGAENAEELDALAETYRVHPDVLDVTVGISLRNIKTGECIAKLPYP